MSSARGVSTALAFAPASIGNVAVGFDVLGLAIEGPGDRVRVSRAGGRGVRITAIHDGQQAVALPLEAERNTATRGLLRFARDTGLDGLEVEIIKGVPLGSGLGGSAASAVAALLAANALQEQPLPRRALMSYVLEGEAAASAATHGDNVAASLFGGLVIAAAGIAVETIPAPAGIRCAVVHPQLQVHTREARAMLRDTLTLAEFVGQSGRLAAFVAACYRNDRKLIGQTLRDALIEPQRQHLVPGFVEVQQAALDEGALGCSLSGSGPSMFAWAPSDQADSVAGAMRDAFAEQDIEARSWVTNLDAPGARLEDSA